MTIRIVADQHILALQAWQDPGVELILCDGRQLSADDVKQADALLVRSITQVDASLLSGSRVQFVGTATSGTDHIDVSYLQQRGIQFINAAGANAAAVADYVMCCLAELQVESGFSLAEKTVAVVGVGHVGSALLTRLQATDAKCLACDPLQQIVSNVPYVSFEEALTADVICLHTPLTRSGDYPTWHMLDAKALSLLSDQAVVINAGRGEAIDNQALVGHLQQQRGHTARTEKHSDAPRQAQRFILDVWENEPNPNPDLLALTCLATPHIAGYSVEAKYAASQRVVTALCEHFGLSVPAFQVPDSAPVFSAPDTPVRSGKESVQDTERGRARQLLSVFSPRQVDRTFRQSYLEADNRQSGAECFDSIRRSLTARRENQA